jgi:molybdopterin-guanine dinucleotide biosynthesis protein A
LFGGDYSHIYLFALGQRKLFTIISRILKIIEVVMSVPSSLLASESISFEEAIALTQSLLSEIEADRLSQAQSEQVVASLVKTPNGARGFFVTYLTDDRQAADRPSPGVLEALREAPEIVAELLVKNLAMSAAMVVYHSRHQSEEMAAGSARVLGRSRNLIQILKMPACQAIASQMLESLQTQEGEYEEFFQRWGYDDEQRVAIGSAVGEAIG